MSHPLELADLMPGTHLGHYVITDKIAQGGMGTVFKALEPALERYVAIKVLRPEYASNINYVQYFQEEARAVAALRHPNIIPIFYIGQEGNVVFFSMAYIEGETFDDYIETRRWFNEERAKWFLSHAVAALHCAHKANIVHLDIKPANFLVDGANNIMLTDFGLAQKIVKAVGEGAEREAFGTPAYVAPEQITRSQTDQRTDIYSLGATLFHLMVGKAPFEGSTIEDVVWAHLEKPFPMDAARSANLPTGWIHLLQKMMERSPDDRFADYRELRTALENVHSFRSETALLEVPQAAKPLSTPRSGNNTKSLHGLLTQGKAQWSVSQEKTSAILQLSRAQVDEALANRLEPLKINSLINTMQELCLSKADDPEALAEVMEKVPGYDPAIRALFDFMVNPEDEKDRAANQTPVAILDVIGLERARSLALTFFGLNYECPPLAPPFDWTPLWRHQLASGIVIDFLYDALNLRRSGFEYVTGAFHDIGKLLFSELFPFAYFTTMQRSLLEEVSLVHCETKMFGLDHAELGSNWLKQQRFPNTMIDAIAQHEMSDKARRSLLGHALVSANHLVKQIGIGYSGNSLLDSRPWEKLPSTEAIWKARRNKEYLFENFIEDILAQFENFPDLV